uniref:Uncharacterized protein n=2 Tax=Gasterosteus aculeatus TaxID=69293 RepID=G3PEQ7_GASAC
MRDNQSGKTLLFEACSQFSCEQTGGPSGEGNITPPAPPGWWRFIILAAATVVVLVVLFFTWKRSKGRETRMDVNAVSLKHETKRCVCDDSLVYKKNKVRPVSPSESNITGILLLVFSTDAASSAPFVSESQVLLLTGAA